MEIRNVKQLIIETMHKSGATPDMFAADLPKNLFEFMRDKVFDDLMFAKDFQQSVEIRDEVKLILNQLLDTWDGKFSKLTKKSLQSSIELADEAGRNKIFGWYINKVSPLIRA